MPSGEALRQWPIETPSPGPVFGTVAFVYGGRRGSALALFDSLGAASRFSGTRPAISGRAEPPASRAVFLYPVLVKTTAGNLWGYIDEQGRSAIPPRYEYALDFQDNGLAIVQSRGKQGVIDASGAYVVRPVYDSISPFSEGLSAVIDGQGFNVMDEAGRILTPHAYAYIGTYHEGRAVFAQSGADGQSRYGYLDARGQVAVPARYLEANDFRNGKAVVKTKDGEYALIGTDGRTLATYPYDFVGTVGEGLLAYRPKPEGTYGYIDKQGRVVIAPRFTAAFPFQDGAAVVNMSKDAVSNKYGLIDKKGAFVIKPDFNEINPLGDGRVAVGQAIDPSRPYVGSLYALADVAGRFLTDFVYTGITEFHRGYASVSDGAWTYWIDRDGKPEQRLPKVAGNGTMAFDHGLIRADVDQRLSYYARDGRPVWTPNTTIPLQPPYVVREMKYKPNGDYLVYYPQVEGMSDPAAEQKANAMLKRLSAVKPVSSDTPPDASYTGDFAVAFYRGKLLVLELNGYSYPFGAAHGMPSKAFVLLNLSSGETYALKQLFKPDSRYVQRISDIIRKQIATDPQYSYVFPGSFQEIAPDQLFYVTDRALHIVFPPYAIAPYAAGFPTFTIPFAELADIIDTSGSFWQSFHS